VYSGQRLAARLSGTHGERRGRTAAWPWRAPGCVPRAHLNTLPSRQHHIACAPEALLVRNCIYIYQPGQFIDIHDFYPVVSADQHSVRPYVGGWSPLWAIPYGAAADANETQHLPDSSRERGRFLAA
jgi:hypothetical protein